MKNKWKSKVNNCSISSQMDVDMGGIKSLKELKYLLENPSYSKENIILDDTALMQDINIDVDMSKIRKKSFKNTKQSNYRNCNNIPSCNCTVGQGGEIIFIFFLFLLMCRNRYH